MINKIQLTHKPVMLGDLDYDIIVDYNAINDNLQRLMEFAYGLYVDQNLCLHYDDDHFPAIVHIIKTVPCLYLPNDTFDEESMDHVCTLIDFVEAERAKHDQTNRNKI